MACKKILKILNKKSFSKRHSIQKIPIRQNMEYEKIQNFNKNQIFRYGYYRRADFKKDKIKKIISIFNPFLKNINSIDPFFITVKGLTKLFIGELIEYSKQVMYENSDSTNCLKKIISLQLMLKSINKTEKNTKFIFQSRRLPL